MRPVIRFSALVAALAGAALAGPVLAQPCPSGVHIPIRYAVHPERPCDGDVVRLVISACGPCVDLLSAEPYPAPLVEARMDLRLCDIEICTLDTLSISLGALRAGDHTVQIPVLGQVVQKDSTTCTVQQTDSFTFRVERCPPGVLPHVDDIVVGHRVVCGIEPCPDLACPGDSIPVLIRGTFPDNCFSLRRIELVPSDLTVIGPPTLRILIDDGGCLARPCIAGPVLWRESIAMPPLPPGGYSLPVELAVVSCSDSFPKDSVHRASRNFVVVPPGTPPCDATLQCFQPWWGGSGGVCNARVAPGQPASVTFEVAPRVAMAGLEGEFVLDPPLLRITGLDAVGPARGMHLQWRPTEHGARFVLFAERGAPIPPYFMRNVGNGWPILAVKVEAPAGVPVPERTKLAAVNLLGADSTGGRLDVCEPFPGFPTHAIICAGSDCDLNADGHADVRDLVLMAHCVLGTGRCDSAGVNLDCNDDGLVELEDVLCCARFILHGGARDSTGMRPEPEIAVTLGSVARSGDELTVPLVLRRADRVGAARFVLSYPADRFEVRAVEVGDPSGWLGLHEVRDQQLVIGLIATAGITTEPADVEVVLRLGLKSNASAAGQVRVVEAEFSGRDGIGLDVELGQPARTLGPGAALALSAGQPNPFSGSTRFTIELEAPGRLEVGVFDLAGRQVAPLFRGVAEAGAREIVWNGRRGDGTPAPSGIYFLRASAGGAVASRRVVLLRGR